MTQRVTQEDRERPEYTEGDIAFSNFMDVDECPYPSCGMDDASDMDGAKRLSWMAGWYDAKYKAQFPRFFDPLHPSYRADLE